MATLHVQIREQIIAIKRRALAELDQHHPDQAVPLLKKALELHRMLRVQKNTSRRDISTSDDLELLTEADLDAVLESADRTAIDVEIYDPFADVAAASVRNGCDAECRSPEGDIDPTVGFENGLPETDAALAPNTSGESTIGEKRQWGGSASAQRDAFEDYTPEDDVFARFERVELEVVEDDADHHEIFDSGESTEASFHDEETGRRLPVADWEDQLPEADEFEEAPTREEMAEIRVESNLTRQERAQQEAIKLGLGYGWDHDGIELLTQVFTLHCWSGAKRSMIRELEAGMTPDELRLALTVREIWRNYPEFHLNLAASYRWGFQHPSLTWPVALAVARHFFSHPDPDEVENFLYGLYAQWRNSINLIEKFTSFYSFVRYEFGLEPQTVSAEPGWSFVPDEYARTIEDDLDSLPLGEWCFGLGCSRTPAAPTLD